MLSLGFLHRRTSTKSSRYLADVRTMFGRARVYDMSDDAGDLMRILDVENTWQSACYLGQRSGELAFRYHQSFADVLEAHGSLNSDVRALMLGGGGFAFPAWLVTNNPLALVDAVEIDAAVIELAERWLALASLQPQERARLTIINRDAVSVLQELQPHVGNSVGNGAHGEADTPRYDLVVNDLFAAEHPESALMNADGARLAHDALKPGGLYLANVVSALHGARARTIVRVTSALEQTFSHVLILPLGADTPRVPDNNVVIASDMPFDWLS